jgi:hypothetical protein
MSGPVFQNRKPDKKSGFRMVKNKMAIFSIRKPDLKSVPKMTIGIPDGPVFGGSL